MPICAMKGGQDLQKYVDLLVPCSAKISLLQGEGPIYLIGSHCVDFYGYKDVDEDEDEATADEEDEVMEEEVKGDKASPAKEGSGSTKRKASSDPPKSDEKKKKASPAK